jgi:regulator of protease activity HflC (stomatin/prohibitin superfamily)
MNNNNEKILNRVSKWMILSGVIILILYMMGCIYIIPEGHLGMYSRGGALLDTVSNPGIHFKLPYITRTYEI